MKTLFLKYWLIFTLFITPLLPLMLIITISTIFDTFVGRWYAKQQGEVITSGKTRRGLCVKLLVYLSVIFLSYLIDVSLINEIAHKYIWIDHAFTKFWTVFFVWIEYTSIDEKLRWVKGEGITEKVVRFFSQLKQTFISIMDFKNKSK